MKTTFFSKVLLLLAALALIISLFVPIWSIYLEAPQYPEGLSLQIWANAIAGNVDIINGLNHYIGMKTLHTNDFIEFTILPYFIIAFALLFIIATIIGRKKWLYIAFWAFVAFGIIAIIDFWKWEYDYGHNLNPNAAIKVPGMAYQPPLIGFKQLLNFGAFSIPDIGGWLLLSAGVCLLIAVLRESAFLAKLKRHNKKTISAALLLIIVSSCSNNKPAAILWNKDTCANCKMSIAEKRFAGQFITQKGRTYKFDDLYCMINYAAENPAIKIRLYYIADYNKNNEQIASSNAFYVHSDKIKSPMGGNVAAFSNKNNAEKIATQLGGAVTNWNDIENLFTTTHNHERTH